MQTYVYALIKREGKVLLLRRSEFCTGWNGFFTFAGGQMMEGESDTDCVIREVCEETQMDFTPYVKVFDGKEADGRIRVIVYFGNAIGRIKKGKEFDKIGWFAVSAVARMKTMPYIKKLIKKGVL
jgi:ADP-ribose pyrophosphatase YjhB (NUDIX family)